MTGRSSFFGTAMAMLAVSALLGCGGSTRGSTGNTELNLDIVNPGGTSGELGFSIDRVDYRITCAGSPAGTYPIPPSDTNGTDYAYDDAVNISGSFEVVDTRTPPVWQAVMDLPPGDCTVTLSVFDGDEIVCIGSQTLAIAEDATTKYDIVLVCSLSIDTPDGMADVDGTFEFITGNVCPKVYVLNALGRDVLFGQVTYEVQYRAKDPDSTCGSNCDPQSCNGANPPVCTPYPSNIQDPVCNPVLGGNPNDLSCLDGSHAGLVCTISAFPTALGAAGGTGGTFLSPLDGVTPVGPVLPVNLNLASGVPGVILPGLGGPVGTSSDGSPVFPPTFPTDQLPPLIYECDMTLPGPVLIDLHCSDGDLECDQSKQISIVCGTGDFCIVDPVDCSASGECLENGTCDNACDPVDAANGVCNRCPGKDDPLPDGTPCSVGACINGVCDSSCPSLTKVVVSPSQANVGDSISVAAEASSYDGGALDYLWTAGAGSFADPSLATTTYLCEQAGQQTLTVTVTNTAGSCADEATLAVTCLGP